jgi:hypothetical protein
VETGLGVLGGCGGGGGVGKACTGIAHCGQTVASSGMEAPHLKQNIHTPLGFRPWLTGIFGVTQSEKYFIHIENAITSRIRESSLVMHQVLTQTFVKQGA